MSYGLIEVIENPMVVKWTQKLSMHTLPNPRENVLLMTPK